MNEGHIFTSSQRFFLQDVLIFSGSKEYTNVFLRYYCETITPWFVSGFNYCSDDKKAAFKFDLENIIIDMGLNNETRPYADQFSLPEEIDFMNDWCC